MKDLQITELTGTIFQYVDTNLLWCSSVKIDDAIFLFLNSERCK